MVKYFNKPYFIAVLICIFVFYSGVFLIPDVNPLISLLPEKNISLLSGKIVSSPIKLSTSKNYSCKVKVLKVKDFYETESSAKGVITVFIPSQIVESTFPGKMYSLAAKQGTGIFEAGAYFSLYGSFSNNIFFVKKTKALGYENNIYGKIDFARAKLRLYFRKLMYSWQEAGGFLLALLSGSREYTEDSVKNAFRNAGLSHILALSGMHLSLFSGIAMFIGSRTKRKNLAFAIRVIFLILFIWFAGFSPSLLRAFICSMLIILSILARKDSPDMILILSFSFMLQCIISPSDIGNYGFILSYSALAGILLLNEKIKHFFNIFISNHFSSSISASISAQCFTAPISLKLFGCFYPIGIIATCIISPFVTIFIYSGLFLIVLSLIFPVISSASGMFMNFEYNIIKNITLFFAKAPFWSIN